MSIKTLNKPNLITHYKNLIENLGENPNREGLLNTPQRACNAMAFLTSGYSENLNEIVNEALFPTTSNEMVIVKDIEFYSLCEHHLLPFFGTCSIGYLPNNQVLGLSKFARIINYHARRLQIQEQLTQDIANTIQKITQAKGVAVIIKSQHLCMMMRGVEKQGSAMLSSVMLGQFKDNPNTRSEFLSLLKS